MGESAEQFLERALTIGGRIVCTGDLNELQISEAQAKGNMWVSPNGFGWVILPWTLTTVKDREREKGYFSIRSYCDK